VRVGRAQIVYGDHPLAEQEIWSRKKRLPGVGSSSLPSRSKPELDPAFDSGGQFPLAFAPQRWVVRIRPDGEEASRRSPRNESQPRRGNHGHDHGQITMITGMNHVPLTRKNPATPAETPQTHTVRPSGIEGFTSLSFAAEGPFGLRKFQIFLDNQPGRPGCFRAKGILLVSKGK